MAVIRSWARTDIGKKRKQNEDAFLADDGLGLYVVADGMGGHAAGEVASAQAVQSIRDALAPCRPILGWLRSEQHFLIYDLHDAVRLYLGSR